MFWVLFGVLRGVPLEAGVFGEDGLAALRSYDTRILRAERLGYAMPSGCGGQIWVVKKIGIFGTEFSRAINFFWEFMCETEIDGDKQNWKYIIRSRGRIKTGG